MSDKTVVLLSDEAPIVELDDAFEPGREQLLGSVLTDPDHLLDVGHADAGEAEGDGGRLGLDVDQRDG